MRDAKISFAGGEVAPEFLGRIDDVKYRTGMAKVRNCIITPQGPMQNRTGFRFVREVKTSASKTRLIPFVFTSAQSFAVELGEGYIRFHTNGATLLTGTPAAYSGVTAYAVGDLVSSGGTAYYCIAATTGNAPPNATYWYAMPGTVPNAIYEIPNSYAAADLFDLHYTQSGDIITLVSAAYPVKELKRYGATKWILADAQFASSLTAPAGVTATPTGGSGLNYSYVVTAVKDEGQEESAPSSAATCSNNLFTTGNYNTITWTAVSGANRYYVYKLSGGIHGYIGQATAASFKDDNIAADMARTPPNVSNPFTGAGNYPAAVGYFQQRRVFGGTTNAPQTVRMTRTGTESNLNYSMPQRTDDALQVKVVARDASPIRHLVPMNELVLLTSSGEFRMSSGGEAAVSPSSVAVNPQSYVGANMAQPLLVNSNLVFVAAEGGHVRELAYSLDANGYVTGDLSIRSPHLFDDYDITDTAYAKSPYPICWLVSTSGKLLGLTYVPEQQVAAWHWHDTDGVFEAVCVVPEGSQGSVLYAIIKRTIGGTDKRYIERLEPRKFATQSDYFFVDSGLTYSGSPATTISGLSHLEGKTVSILAGGAVHPSRTVTGGQVTLDYAASKVQIGLPYLSEGQTLPFVAQVDGANALGRQKNVSKVFVGVKESAVFGAGPSFDQLSESRWRTNEPYGTPPAVSTREISLEVNSDWNNGGQICIQQKYPLPLKVVYLAYDVTVGG